MWWWSLSQLSHATSSANGCDTFHRVPRPSYRSRAVQKHTKQHSLTPRILDTYSLSIRSDYSSPLPTSSCILPQHFNLLSLYFITFIKLIYYTFSTLTPRNLFYYINWIDVTQKRNTFGEGKENKRRRERKWDFNSLQMKGEKERGNWIIVFNVHIPSHSETCPSSRYFTYFDIHYLQSFSKIKISPSFPFYNSFFPSSKERMKEKGEEFKWRRKIKRWACIEMTPFSLWISWFIISFTHQEECSI